MSQDMSNLGVAWAQVLEPLMAPRGLSVSHITQRINVSGALIDLSKHSHATTSPQKRKIGAVISEVVHPEYHQAINAWLSRCFSSDRGSLPFVAMCPLTLSEIIWVELRLSNLQKLDGELTADLTVTDLTEVLYRIRLSARATGFVGFKHDLANRLFFFRALPDLIEFSPPEELIKDITDEVPRLSAFLDERLSPQWVDGVNREEHGGHLQTAQAIIARFDAHPRLSSMIIFDHGDTLKQLNAMESPRYLRSQVSLDLEWSLIYLIALLKRGELIRDVSDPEIRLTLSVEPAIDFADHSQTLVGDCGSLVSDATRLRLTLDLSALKGVSLKESDLLWRKRAQIVSSRSNLQRVDPDQEVHLSAWLESWISASHALMGAMFIESDHITSIRF